MKLPVRLPEHHPFQRWLAACLIALLCTLLGVALSAPIRILAAVRLLDQVFYDSLYRLRPIESKQDGPIVIVAVDDVSIEAVDKAKKFGWPWPREFWGHIAKYAESQGAKAVVIDLLFDRSSVHNAASDDDNVFAAIVNDIKIPVVLATYARPDGTLWNVAPPVSRIHVGAANVSRDDLIRTYDPIVHGHDSLAVSAVKRTSVTPPDWARQPFLLRYYGPHANANNAPATFRYVRSANVLAAALEPQNAALHDIRPDLFKDKIVLIAAITAGTYDLKASPLSAKYPGVEVHATAMQNMLEGRRVVMVGPVGRVAVMLAACLLAGIATLLSSRTWMKIIGSASGVVFVLIMTSALFAGRDITWLPPGAALLAALACGFISIAYSYLTELRQRRLILRALTHYVSKPVADEIAKHRAFVIISDCTGLQADQSVLAVAVTSTFRDPPGPQLVAMRWNERGTTETKFQRKCFANVDWVLRIDIITESDGTLALDGIYEGAYIREKELRLIAAAIEKNRGS